MVTGRFAYWSFRLPPVRLRLDSIRLRTVCQFAYLLNNCCIKNVTTKLKCGVEVRNEITRAYDVKASPNLNQGTRNDEM